MAACRHTQHGIKAAGRRAKACPSQRAGFWAGLGAGQMGRADLAGIKGVSLAEQTPPHGQAMARLECLVMKLAINTHVYSAFLNLFDTIDFGRSCVWTMFFAQRNFSRFTSRLDDEINDENCKSDERYQRDKISSSHELKSLMKRRVQKHLVGIVDITVQLRALFCVGVKVMSHKRALLTPLVDRNANAKDEQSNKYPQNYNHTFQHTVETADFQGAAPCYS